MPKPRTPPTNDLPRRGSRAAFALLPLALFAGLAMAFIYCRVVPLPAAIDAKAPAHPAGLDDDPDMRLAAQALRDRRPLDAVRHYEDAGRRNPLRVEPLVGLAKGFLDARRLDDALRAARAAVDLAPEDARAQTAAGKALYAAGNLPAAEQSFARAAALDAQSAEPAYYAGKIAADRKQFEVAIADFRRALALDPGHLAAAHDLATYLTEASDFAGAEQVLSAALARSPGNLSLELNRARLYLKKGDATRAVEAYARVLPQIADAPVAQNDYGQALLLAGRDEDALVAFRRAAAMDTTLPEPWYGIGQLYQRRGDAAEAEKAFAQFRKTRELRQTLRSFEARLRNAPGDVETLVALGRLLLEAGKPRDALARLRVALALSAESGREHPEARRLVEEASRALGLDPNAK
jgi:tetratricopeptide (TPR) repeat protein